MGDRRRVDASPADRADATADLEQQGRRANVVADCLDQVAGAGTFFAPTAKRPSAKKRWLAWGGEPKGTLFVNTCARRALEDEGRSLLPVGVTGVAGTFDGGDTVHLVEDVSGEEFGRGVVRYDGVTCARLAGMATDNTVFTTGGAAPTRDELIHRDEMALYGK